MKSLFKTLIFYGMSGLILLLVLLPSYALFIVSTILIAIKDILTFPFAAFGQFMKGANK